MSLAFQPFPQRLFFLDRGQFFLNVDKFGSILSLVLPTSLHDPVHLIWTLLWAGHSVAYITHNTLSVRVDYKSIIM